MMPSKSFTTLEFTAASKSSNSKVSSIVRFNNCMFINRVNRMHQDESYLFRKIDCYVENHIFLWTLTYDFEKNFWTWRFFHKSYMCSGSGQDRHGGPQHGFVHWLWFETWNHSRYSNSFRPRPYTFWNAAIPQILQSVAFMISTLVEVPGVFGRAKFGAEGTCITHWSYMLGFNVVDHIGWYLGLEIAIGAAVHSFWILVHLWPQ